MKKLKICIAALALTAAGLEACDFSNAPNGCATGACDSGCSPGKPLMSYWCQIQQGSGGSQCCECAYTRAVCKQSDNTLCNVSYPSATPSTDDSSYSCLNGICTS